MGMNLRLRKVPEMNQSMILYMFLHLMLLLCFRFFTNVF